MNDLRKPLNYPIITGRPDSAQPLKPQQPATIPQGETFGDLLQKTLQQTQARPVTFSKHAQARAAQRGIELSNMDIEKLGAAIGRAGEKGVTDTLVFMNNTAFIVNVPSRVVVTVVDGGETEHQIFTNINGAVIL